MQVFRFRHVTAILVAVALTLLASAGCAPRGASQGQSAQPPASPQPAPTGQQEHARVPPPQPPGGEPPGSEAPTEPDSQPRPPVEPALFREAGIIVREFPLQEEPDGVYQSKRMPINVQEDWGDRTHGIVDGQGQRRPSVADINDAIQAWGFSLKPLEQPAPGSATASQLLKDGKKVAEFSFIRGLSRSADGRRAVFVAEGPQAGDALFQDGKLQDWDTWATDYVSPIFVGNTLYSLDKVPTNAAGTEDYSIRKEGQEAPVYTFKADLITSSPIHGFFSMGDSWVVECSDHVVIAGKDLGAANGYAKVFNYRLLAGKPFYFFQKGDKVEMSFDGQTLSRQYDLVLHNNCCESGIANPSTSEIAVRFFAQRDGQWYYVSALVRVD